MACWPSWIERWPTRAERRGTVETPDLGLQAPHGSGAGVDRPPAPAGGGEIQRRRDRPVERARRCLRRPPGPRDRQRRAGTDGGPGRRRLRKRPPAMGSSRWSNWGVREARVAVGDEAGCVADPDPRPDRGGSDQETTGCGARYERGRRGARERARRGSGPSGRCLGPGRPQRFRRGRKATGVDLGRGVHRDGSEGHVIAFQPATR